MYQPKILSIHLGFFGNSLDNLGLETDTQVNFSCIEIFKISKKRKKQGEGC